MSSFERGSDLRSCQFVVAVTALRANRHEPSLDQSTQLRRRSRGMHTG
jgi:hypothetical protein